MDEERRKKELERLKATLDALDKFKKHECSFDDASTSLKGYMNIGQCECVYFLDKFEEEKAFTKIHSELQINHALLETNQLYPSMIIAESTALCGTYFKRDHSDWNKPTLPLVNVRQDVEFKTPNIAETNIRVEFDDENSTSENQNQNKFTIISNFTVPVSLWEPNLKQLTLSENVIEKLECIQNCLGTNEAKTLALDFLREFGSHLYLGNIHFGGIFKVETTFKGCNIHEKAMIRDSIRYRHLVSLCSYELYLAESGANSSEVESHDYPLLKAGKFIGEDKHNVKTTLSVLGGPQNVSSLLLWKKGLVYNNRTWAVVHAGKPEELKGKLVLEHYIGIWDLVKNDKIETAFGVPEFLKHTWEESSGFKPDDVSCETLKKNVSCKWELKSCIDYVAKRLSSNVEAQIFVDSLKNLYEKVVETTTVEGCQKLWKQELISNVSIADVLTKVTTISFSEEQRSEVKALVEKLLTLADNVEFLSKYIIQLWLKYNISVNQESSLWKTKQHSLADLQSSLKPYLGNINIKYKTAEADKKGGITLPQNVTLEVGVAVCELLNEFKGKVDSLGICFFCRLYCNLVTM